MQAQWDPLISGIQLEHRGPVTPAVRSRTQEQLVSGVQSSRDRPSAALGENPGREVDRSHLCILPARLQPRCFRCPSPGKHGDCCPGNVTVVPVPPPLYSLPSPPPAHAAAPENCSQADVRGWHLWWDWHCGADLGFLGNSTAM